MSSSPPAEWNEGFACFDTADYREGLRAFLAKQPPQLRGSLMGPLAGIKVLELAHIMSGPTAGMLLADMGADVIKVEKIPGGDDTRRFAPPEINGEASAFLMMNRNKRGIALDLRQPAAKAALRRIIDQVDVVIENFRAGTMAKLGLGFDVLRQTNPALIYCAVSGYGLSGPDADKGGFDLVAQGLSGLMRITGEPGGRTHQGWLARHRHQCRDPRRVGHRQRVRASPAHRARPTGRHIPARSRRDADVLAERHLFGLAAGRSVHSVLHIH